jgi:hypothetical protein
MLPLQLLALGQSLGIRIELSELAVWFVHARDEVMVHFPKAMFGRNLIVVILVIEPEDQLHLDSVLLGLFHDFEDGQSLPDAMFNRMDHLFR